MSTLKKFDRRMYILNPNDPVMSYFRTKGKIEKCIHFGQLKLLDGVIQFLTNFWDPKEVPHPIVVYAGAAPGQNIEVLSLLFPAVTWHLYDPSSFCIKPSERIKIYTGDEGYFTNTHANKWARRNDVFFISDIRGPYKSVIENLSLEEEYEKLQNDPHYASELLTIQEKNEQLVANDMNSQKQWYKIIRPVHALLKFRLPYAYKHFKKEFNYLNGHIYFQPWVGPNSTETRLVPIGYDDIEWDINIYEEQMFYFNRITRVSKYMNPFSDRQKKSAIQWPILTNDFDSLAHVYILMDYLTKFNINFNTDMVLKLSDTVIYGININFSREFNFLAERKKACTIYRRGYDQHEE
jgi:hypothetical protein